MEYLKVDPMEFYEKGGISNHRDKDGLFKKWCWGNWLAIWKMIKLDLFLIP